LVICRFEPKWLDIRGNPKLYHITDFAPYKETLLEYKNNGNWGLYVEKFTQQMNEDPEFQRLANNLVKAITSGEKYCLICYEKDYTHCHRYLIAKWLEEKYGVKWEEI
jgi:uncharacterized protein YeaO (DUF488 family)